MLAAWPMIEAAAHKINREHPDLPRKVLAGRLHELALREFDEDDVPNEATILRRLGSILGDTIAQGAQTSSAMQGMRANLRQKETNRHEGQEHERDR